MKTTIIILLTAALASLGWLHQRDVKYVSEVEQAAKSLRLDNLALESRIGNLESDNARCNDLAASKEERIAALSEQPEIPTPATVGASTTAAVPPAAVSQAAPPVKTSPDPAARIAFLRTQVRQWQRQLSDKESEWREEDRKGGLKKTAARDRQILRDKVAASIAAANAEIDRLGKGL